MDPARADALDFVAARIACLAEGADRASYVVHPPSSGRAPATPPKQHFAVRIHDCRPVVSGLSLDVEGFAFRRCESVVREFGDDGRIRREYYPEVERVVRDATGALEVFAFDHNVRSVVGAAERRPGIRMPVDMAHNDYTESSGPRRTREILEERGRTDLAGHAAALVNLWRPIRGPVQDLPLAVCEAGSTAPEDFVPTPIEHYGDEDPLRPRHRGEIYSFRHRPGHRWFYVRDMRPDEVLLLKCFDSRRDGRARYTAHTGFSNPDCPAGAVPRESIEVRTLVVFPR